MYKLSPSEEKIFSVSEYIDFLNRILVPQEAVIQGEITSVDNRVNYTFFTLQDKTEEAILKCFIWKVKLDGLGIELKEGLELKIQGYPTIYKKYGRFTFEVQNIGLVGEGALKLAFEKLKRNLALEGYFAEERKKKVPDYAQVIGLITSGQGAAIKDFHTHLGHFGFRIYFYNIHVEGLYAMDDIVAAIRWFNENMFDIDVLVLIRGGGSLESLQAFNTESVAKAIFGSRIPIITGIGHENDDTIADFIADVRASTPTHAGRIISDPWRNAQDSLRNYERSIISIFNKKFLDLQKDLFLFEDLLSLAIKKQFNEMNKEFNRFRENLNLSFQNLIKYFEIYTTQIEHKLRLGDPTLRLKQGYSIVFNNNQVIKSSKQLKVGDEVRLKLYEGGAISSVEKIQL